MKIKSIIRAVTPPFLYDAASRMKRRPVEVAQAGIQEIECAGFHWRLDMSSCIAQEIARGEAWEPDTTALVRDLVKPGMIVFDIGANFGYFTLIMARLVGETGHVYAFEPTAHFREQLQWHVAQNDFQKRVTILPFGLSDESSQQSISINASSATMHDAGNSTALQEEIELRRLDDVAGDLGIKRLDFIKIDIDGHEPAFLRGAAQTLRRFQPPIALEFAQHCLHIAGSDVREQARLLREAGYVICRETTRQPFETEMDFLIACGNFSDGSNALALPSH